MERKDDVGKAIAENIAHGIARAIAIGIAVAIGFVLFILLGGLVVQWLWNWLLPDIFGVRQITVGQWISDHGAVPTEDVYSFTMRGQPWISTQWLAQVLYAKAFAVAGWTGPVVLAASAIAATFMLLVDSSRRFSSASCREDQTSIEKLASAKMAMMAASGGA